MQFKHYHLKAADIEGGTSITYWLLTIYQTTFSYHHLPSKFHLFVFCKYVIHWAWKCHDFSEREWMMRVVFFITAVVVNSFDT